MSGASSKRTDVTRKPRNKAAPLQIQTVWKQMTPELKSELLAFWASNNAVKDPERAVRRVEQAVCLARGSDGAISGVATAELRVLPRLLQPMYYFRLFLSKSVRGQGQVIPLYSHAKAALQAYNAALPEPESIGVLVELESQFLVRFYRNAYVAEADSTFIGYSPRGLQLRVSYFVGAVLMPPVHPTPAI
jgi:hypothetical protein